jgi:hypothetical protein
MASFSSDLNFANFSSISLKQIYYEYGYHLQMALYI